MGIILVLQILTCFMMTGLIWVIQLVHYPSFSFVDLKSFTHFEKFHSNKITWIVLPLMLIELLTALFLVLNQFDALFIFNLAAVILIWLSTFFLSIPIHSQLLKNHNEDHLKKLVLTNWPRTILWSLRSALWTYFLLSLPLV